ncbi:MAG: cytochrome c3 family protein [Planctomycetaceae bacterium]
MGRFTFPAWVNSLVLPMLGVIGLGVVYLAVLIPYAGSPETLVAGYQPEQPVPFSHALHAGEMKLDCRYCHSHVFESSHSNIPATATCGNCHNHLKGPDGTNLTVAVHTDSIRLEPVRKSLATGVPVEWERVHDLPDYAYFDHSAHVNRGVSCVECHGRIDKMEVVERFSPLNMGWCLDCHRDPTEHLRPLDLITKLDWQPEGDTPEEVAAKRLEIGEQMKEELGIRSLTDCSTCHR